MPLLAGNVAWLSNEDDVKIGCAKILPDGAIALIRNKRGQKKTCTDERREAAAAPRDGCGL